MYWYDEEQRLNGSSHQVAFWCDDVSDIMNLPTSTTEGVKQGDSDTLHLPVAKGSTCLVIAESTMFVLNSSDQWIEM